MKKKMEKVKVYWILEGRYKTAWRIESYPAIKMDKVLMGREEVLLPSWAVRKAE